MIILFELFLSTFDIESECRGRVTGSNDKLFIRPMKWNRREGTLDTMKQDSRFCYGIVVFSMGWYSAKVTRVELRKSASLIYCNTPS